MALKKSQLYSSLWASCNELRGGMDASQYKDYVLVLLFIKYISDKYACDTNSLITIPIGAGFKDMVAFKGKGDIGDQINKVISKLAKANDLQGIIDQVDFNNENKLGRGREKVDRLTNLIAIFENPVLDFSTNQSDDVMPGDTFEYLYRRFATESGQRMEQPYTPTEVSGMMAQVLGIREAKTSASTTVYDPTCGLGSLLLNVGDEAGTDVTLYGQEKNFTTFCLARMNMIMNGIFTAVIAQGNTLAAPSFVTGNSLNTFDYVVAHPPFSDKSWSTGTDAANDPFLRFSYGIPPPKSGDFAYIQHMLASLKPNGVMAVVAPHGILFRGGREASIRQAILEADLVEAVIGLPPNLLYQTGIPICVLVCNKNKPPERAHKIIFINASRDFAKSDKHNTLRPEATSRIVDAFQTYSDNEQFSRVVHLDEIRENSHSLHISRYVDSSELHSLLKQHCGKFEKYLMRDLALVVNSGVQNRAFEEIPNSVYIPKILRRWKPTDNLCDLHSHDDQFYQVILDNRALSAYVAQFLNTSIGQFALFAIATGNVLHSLRKTDLDECIIALPSIDDQHANVETHKKLTALKESIENIVQELSLNPTKSTEFQSQLDSMLQAVGQLSDADSLRSIIRQGESKTVEFKETYTLCLRRNTKEYDIEKSALKTIVAFLNSDGGALLCGVNDALQIVGIDRELKKFFKDNSDHFLKHLKNRIKSKIGEEFYPFINYNVVVVDGCIILHVNCKQSNRPCFLDTEEFYVRTNPATDRIEGAKLLAYVKNRFDG